MIGSKELSQYEVQDKEDIEDSENNIEDDN